jgi:hypothetical protein
VAYGTDPDRVIEILIGVARKHPAVLADPAPMAVFDRFGDSALNFTLFCWSFVDRFFLARSELTIAINNAFKEAGIEIPFPHQVAVPYGDEDVMPVVTVRTAGEKARRSGDPDTADATEEGAGFGDFCRHRRAAKGSNTTQNFGSGGGACGQSPFNEEIKSIARRRGNVGSAAGAPSTIMGFDTQNEKFFQEEIYDQDQTCEEPFANGAARSEPSLGARIGRHAQED